MKLDSNWKSGFQTAFHISTLFRGYVEKGLWKPPLFCPHPLWTGQTMGLKEFRHFSTMFSPTAYYYELYPSSLRRSARDPGEPLLSP